MTIKKNSVWYNERAVDSCSHYNSQITEICSEKTEWILEHSSKCGTSRQQVGEKTGEVVWKFTILISPLLQTSHWRTLHETCRDTAVAAELTQKKKKKGRKKTEYLTEKESCNNLKTHPKLLWTACTFSHDKGTDCLSKHLSPLPKVLLSNWSYAHGQRQKIEDSPH